MNTRQWEDLYNSLCVFEGGSSSPLSRRVLVAIGFTGIVATGCIAPGILEGFERLRISKKKYSNRQVSYAFSALKKKGLVSIRVSSDGSKQIVLTERGRDKLYNYCLSSIAIHAQKRWDKKWWVVIFDVPVQKNAIRIHFRNFLKHLGFKQIQQSVWVIPYKCQDEVFFLAKALHIEKYVDILVVEKFYDNEKYRRLFFDKM